VTLPFVLLVLRAAIPGLEGAIHGDPNRSCRGQAMRASSGIRCAPCEARRRAHAVAAGRDAEAPEASGPGPEVKQPAVSSAARPRLLAPELLLKRICVGRMADLACGARLYNPYTDRAASQGEVSKSQSPALRMAELLWPPPSRTPRPRRAWRLKRKKDPRRPKPSAGQVQGHPTLEIELIHSVRLREPVQSGSAKLKNARGNSRCSRPWRSAPPSPRLCAARLLAFWLNDMMLLACVRGEEWPCFVRYRQA
jgi:hypothetical protein